MKTKYLLLSGCAASLITMPFARTLHAQDIHTAKIESAPNTQNNKTGQILENERPVHAGYFLASRFAQSQHDWKSANYFIEALLNEGVDDPELKRRAMVLSMGAGDTKRAMELAKENASVEMQQNISIANIFLITQSLKNEDYKNAATLLKTLPHDGTAKFVLPFLNAWTQAGNGHLDVSALNQSAIQVDHAILISDFLDNHDEIKKLLSKALKVENISSSEIEKIADVYAHIGDKEKALSLYESIAKELQPNAAREEKMSAIKNGTQKPLIQKVKTAREGMAKAYFNIATLLHQDYNDESAKIFAQMSLYLDKNLSENNIILASIAERHNQEKDAISYYAAIPFTNENYNASQYKIAEIQEDLGQEERALETLNALADHKNDIEAIIRIGDLYRGQSDFQRALETYNRAALKLKNNIPEDFWHLLYVRGMTEESLGNWEHAEKDLLAALKFRPNHPYILNYLGYAWADRGKNLDQAMEMISKAVEYRPDDGYIVDSLGWVKFKRGDYNGAAESLENAITLMPYDATINDHLGDAYWMVGRKREAKFQWTRAKNHTTDAALIEKLDKKIAAGLDENFALTEAHNK